MAAVSSLLVFPMRCESHFNPSFGNVKAFNLKKIKKINAEPVAAMAAGGPAAGGQRQASSLGRPKAGPSLETSGNPYPFASFTHLSYTRDMTWIS